MDIACRELTVQLREAFAMSLHSTKLTSLGISLQSEKSRPVLPRVFLVFVGDKGQP